MTEAYTKLFRGACRGCEKELLVNEELMSFALYCEDCPSPPEPCETCGKPDCDGSCCTCQYCLERRASS